MTKQHDFTVRDSFIIRVREHKTGYDIALGTPHHAIWLDVEDLKALAKVLPTVLVWLEVNNDKHP